MVNTTSILAADPATVRALAAGITMVLGTVITAALAGWGWLEWRRKGRCQMFVLLAGSVIGWLSDPAFQTVAHIEVGAPTSVSPGVFGYLVTSQEPLWCVFTYPMWVCFVSYLAFYAMQEQWSRRRLWFIFAATSVVDAVAEIPYIRTGLYSYADSQAFRVLGFPLAWAPTYMAMGILLGTLLHLLNQQVHGWRWLLVVPMVGSGYLALTFVAGWPLVFATHTHPAQPWLSLWALAAVAFEVAMVYVLSLYLPATRQQRESVTTPAAVTGVQA